MDIYLNCRKTFDCLSHDHLLPKLQELVFHDNAWKWFGRYLVNHSQLVELKQEVNGSWYLIGHNYFLWQEVCWRSSYWIMWFFILFTYDFRAYKEHLGKAIVYADDTVHSKTSDNKFSCGILQYVRAQRKHFRSPTTLFLNYLIWDPALRKLFSSEH